MLEMITHSPSVRCHTEIQELEKVLTGPVSLNRAYSSTSEQFTAHSN